MKRILFKTVTPNLPDLTGDSGNGILEVPDALYYEYMHKLTELLVLSERIKQLAKQQGIPFYGI